MMQCRRKINLWELRPPSKQHGNRPPELHQNFRQTKENETERKRNIMFRCSVTKFTLHNQMAMKIIQRRGNDVLIFMVFRHPTILNDNKVMMMAFILCFIGKRCSGLFFRRTCYFGTGILRSESLFIWHSSAEKNTNENTSNPWSSQAEGAQCCSKQ